MPYINMRSIYEIREQSSRMYAWSALITSQLMVEIPLNIICSAIFFLCWYWTVGFDSDRGGYTYLFLSVLMPIYCASLCPLPTHRLTCNRVNRHHVRNCSRCHEPKCSNRRNSLQFSLLICPHVVSLLSALSASPTDSAS